MRLKPGLLLTALAALSLSVLSLAGCLVPEPASEGIRREVEALEGNPWGDPDAVVVRVNGVTITRGEFYKRVLRRFGTHQVLGGVVKQELFRQEAAERGIEVSMQEIAAAVEKRLMEDARMLGVSGDDPLGELAKLAESQRLSLEDLRQDMESIVRPQLLVSKVVKSLRVVDDGTLRTEYKKTYAKTRYRLSHIAYSYGRPAEPEDENRKRESVEKAMRTYLRIRDGSDFAEIARKESEDEVTWQRGGDLGVPVSHEDMKNFMLPQMREAILKLEPGGISEPVVIPERRSVHIFKLNEILKHRSFDDVRDQLAREMREREPDAKEVEQALKRLNAQADVIIFGIAAPARAFDSGPPISPRIGPTAPGPIGRVR